MQIFKNFRSYFFRGMAALLPTILTIWLFVQFYLFVQKNISTHINRFIVKLGMFIMTKTEDLDAIGVEKLRNSLDAFWITGNGQIAGFIVALIVICIIGAILASVVGKTIWKSVDKTLRQVPIIKRVYPYVKQITDFVFSGDKITTFKKVVAIEYPRKGIWSVGLVTGSGIKKVVEGSGKKEDFLTVFIPSSPTPFTGYVIMIPESESIELDVSIEEILRFTVSGGVITPSEWESRKELSGEDELKK